MRILLLLGLTVAAASPAAAQANRDDLTPLGIEYTTTTSDDLEGLHIEVSLERVNRPRLLVSMPQWAPGSYRIGNFGRAVQNLAVTGADGAPLEVELLDQGTTWSVATNGERSVRITYDINIGRGGRFGRANDDEERTGMSVSGPSTYVYVHGAASVPVTSRYVLPEGWGIANGLLRTEDSNVRWARDYDTFIDAPTILGAFRQQTFEVEGTPFHCVFYQNSQEYDFDIDAFVQLVEKIVRNQGELFGSYPFPDYWFLFTIPGGGGLEHLNSTSIGLSDRSQRSDPSAGASVTSHEFFHAWNVKRIRPKVLGPFDYGRENYTGNLWVAEGWTSYFGDLTLARTGIWDREKYLRHLAGIIGRELGKERRKEHSVDWASRNVWHRFQDEGGSRVDYYAKGEILGMVIDLEIRNATDGRLSLNDVMRFMNRWFAERGVGFEEYDVERACTAVSNHDFAEFFARHVYGTLDPPLEQALSYVGIDYEEKVIPSSFPFRERDGRILRAAGRGDDETEDPDAPRPGDQIVLIDGAEFEDTEAVLAAHAEGDVLTLTLEREDERREVQVTLGGPSNMVPKLTLDPNATERQLRLREAWLTSPI